MGSCPDEGALEERHLVSTVVVLVQWRLIVSNTGTMRRQYPSSRSVASTQWSRCRVRPCTSFWGVTRRKKIATKRRRMCVPFPICL